MNILNDISAVYMEQVAESAVPGKPAEKLGAVTAIPKSEQEAARERLLAKAKAKRESMKEERNDEPGEGTRQKYGDMRGLNRSGAPTSFGGKWQSKERKAAGAAALAKLNKEETEIDEAQKPNDGNLANNYPPYDKITRGDVIAGRLGKDKMGGKKKKSKGMKEGFSNWRQDLSEVMDSDEKNAKIKEKNNINNKVKTSAIGGGIKLGEAVEEIGGTLLEMVEIDEVDYIIESAYNELIEEGYDENDIEEALEYALTEAKVTFGHDTSSTEKKKEGLLSAARKKLSGVKASAKAVVARGARKVAKGALGVARKMEGDDNKANPRSKGAKPTSAPKRPPSAAGTKEKVSSGSYQAPATTKKKAEKAEKPADPWEGSYKKSSEVETKPKPKPKATTKKTAAPKAKAPAAAPKRKRKASKLDALLSNIRSEEFKIDEAVYGGTPAKKEEPKDTLYTVTAADKKGNTAAYQKYKAGDKRYKAAPHLGEETLDEKALSKQQQKLFGLALSVKRGETPRSEASAEVLKIVDSMSEKKIRDFAKTEHKGLPNIKESATEMPMTPQELNLQKRKTAIDLMIAKRRQQALLKNKNQQKF